MGKIKLSTVGKNALNHIQKTRDSLQSLKKSLLEREYRMNIRWRLSVVAIQLLILSTSTYITTGQFYSGATWFSAGLFSVVIGSQILEPFYSGPTDIIGNVVISILLWLTTEKEAAYPAWIFFLIVMILNFALALIALIFGAGKEEGRFVKFARFSSFISSKLTALLIYSVIFWLALIETYPKYESAFWTLGISWAIIVFIGSINWQKTFLIFTGKKKECTVEEMIGPSRVSIKAHELPRPGSQIVFKTKDLEIKGSVISRIQRQNDVWGQIYINHEEDCEELLKSKKVSIETLANTNKDIIGIVDVGSTQSKVIFHPNRPLEIGGVVTVQNKTEEILYQINSAEVQQLNIKGGGQLEVKVQAHQIGIFDKESLRIRQHRWVPNLGTAISTEYTKPENKNENIPPEKMLIGYLLGTEIPIYFDTELAQEGHLAILGMTKMGKTSFALNLINELAKKRTITVLDQTGEYIKKRKLSVYDENQHDRAKSGIAVNEPPDNTRNKVAADYALEYFEKITKIARREYEASNVTPRVILIEEAHQFVPEPSGLGFNAPGRDSAYKFGSLLMQVRKYGISTILISQRTAVVAKSALSQCENIIAFKSGDKTGLDYFDRISGHDMSNILPTPRQGEAVVFGPAFSCDIPVAIKIPKPTEENGEEIFENEIETNNSLEMSDFDIPEPPPNFPEMPDYDMPEPPPNFDDDIPF